MRALDARVGYERWMRALDTSVGYERWMRALDVSVGCERRSVGPGGYPWIRTVSVWAPRLDSSDIHTLNSEKLPKASAVFTAPLPFFLPRRPCSGAEATTSGFKNCEDFKRRNI